MDSIEYLGWTKADIKAALEDEGWSCRQLSFSRGYTSNAVQTALHRPYPAIERIIADVIGVSACEIWPERYGKDGKPNRKIGRRKMNGA
ncbi:helix-turn-helix domain-containing protein [Pseudoalteromonas sp. SWN29]|uniref:helix-turn-helix domain-containing protein n=1 Tax=Pseudoalteromonas sp. SWN29 TaxID=2792064 RepID=UPI0018CF1855|nr:helix-turn-helix domain-containing protein [Pseudoalteromonas sp. SWN29]MBH0026313.1 helix-turn-helix domain-containing protein [Pseudoalteromonas sp. SWN29]